MSCRPILFITTSNIKQIFIAKLSTWYRNNQDLKNKLRNKTKIINSKETLHPFLCKKKIIWKWILNRFLLGQALASPHIGVHSRGPFCYRGNRYKFIFWLCGFNYSEVVSQNHEYKVTPKSRIAISKTYIDCSIIEHPWMIIAEMTYCWKFS